MDERDGRIGYWISGGAHIALILWALLGGVFFRPQPSMPVRTTEVATMSGAEFEEYAAASRGAGPVRDEATSAADLPEPETEDDAASPPEQTTAPETEPAQELAEPNAPEESPDLSGVEQQPPAATVTTELPGSPETPDEAEAAPDAPSETQPPPASEPTRPMTTPRPQDRPAELVNQQVADEAARLAAEAERAEAAQQAEAAAEAEREAAEQREAEERAAQAEAERREAEAEEQRRQEQARRAEREQQAEQERRAAEEQAAREEEQRRAEEVRQAEEQRRAAEQRAEEERRQAEEERRRAEEAARAEAEEQAAEEARREEERRAAAERERQEREAREREQAERERAEREAAERAEQEAADQRALEEALREAQESGAEGEDTATTGESIGGNRQRIEGGSGASATQDALGAALSEALSQGQTAPADEPAPADLGAEPSPDSLLEPVPITPTPLPDPDEQSSLDRENGGAAPLGQPLSLAERDGLRMAMQDCWNRGALSVEASRVSVSIEFRMLPDARPDIASLRLIDSSTNGSQTAVQNAYETARRAILQCGRAGYPLPAEKYGRWRTVIVDFRPDGINFE